MEMMSCSRSLTRLGRIPPDLIWVPKSLIRTSSLSLPPCLEPIKRKYLSLKVWIRSPAKFVICVLFRNLDVYA